MCFKTISTFTQALLKLHRVTSRTFDSNVVQAAKPKVKTVKVSITKTSEIIYPLLK